MAGRGIYKVFIYLHWIYLGVHHLPEMSTMTDPNEYFISFDTKINPGKIEAIRVRIDVVTISDMKAVINIDLCNHPLYSDLKQYVKSNP